MSKLCTIPSCGRKVASKKLCATHLSRLLKNGDTQADVPIGFLHRINKRTGKHNKFGDKNPRWSGGTIDDGHGRILIYSPSHPNPSWCGTHVYRYRLLMEAHIGRYLKSDEVIHHINGDISDDRIENLEIMTQSEHAKRHNKNGKFET